MDESNIKQLIDQSLLIAARLQRKIDRVCPLTLFLWLPFSPPVLPRHFWHQEAKHNSGHGSRSLNVVWRITCSIALGAPFSNMTIF
jgi:hypothetical protein